MVVQVVLLKQAKTKNTFKFIIFILFVCYYRACDTVRNVFVPHHVT